MEPIIHSIPKSNIINLNKTDVQFNTFPSPQLVKYGFNNIKMDMIALTSNQYYQVGLAFDFTRKDKDSLITKGAKYFKNLNQPFCELWEIITLFDLFSTTQTISTNQQDTVKDIITAYQQLTKSKHKYTVQTKNISLAIYYYSPIDLDENTHIQLLTADLPDILASNSKGGNLIIQLFGTQTAITAELIYYLTSLYTEAYFVKPMTTSDLSDCKYLVLLGLKGAATLVIPKHNKNHYLSTIGLKIPTAITIAIQCINSVTFARKLSTYCHITSYINRKILEGPIKDEMVATQNAHVMKWLELVTDPKRMKQLLDKVVNTTKC
jgi:hypothetical protein